ncbi:MAG TPA: hypothetical protein VMN78_11690 [Longimicrobiales bacterium]|nr:hypothetical protein [Longimicrobiales bacterium]
MGGQLADVVSGIAAIRSAQRPVPPSSARRWPRNEALATVGALLALVLVGVLLTSGFYAAFRSSIERRTKEGASVLAREGLRSYAAAVTTDELLQLPIGEDSTVAAADVAAGDSFVGAYAVLVERLDGEAVLVTAIGILAGRGYPITCTITVQWQLDDASARALDGATVPHCARSGVRPIVIARTRQESS